MEREAVVVPDVGVAREQVVFLLLSHVGRLMVANSESLPSVVAPPRVPVVRIPCAVVPIFPASFRGMGSCLLEPVDGRGFGSSTVAQHEPFCDFCRRFAPAVDEALSAQEGSVPLSASP